MALRVGLISRLLIGAVRHRRSYGDLRLISSLSAARRSPHPSAPPLYLQSLAANRFSGTRQFSVISELSKQLKGEADGNLEFQQSVKQLNQKVDIFKEDLRVRAKNTTEKLYKSVDDVWTEAEATSRKVSADLKEKFSAARDEVKESFGLGKETAESTCSGSAQNESNPMSGAERSQCSDASTNESESAGQIDLLFNKFKLAISSASPTVSLVFQRIKESNLSEIAKKGYDIVKDELISDPSKRRHMKYPHGDVSSDVRSTRTDIVIAPSKKSRLHEKWEAFKNKVEAYPIFKRIKEVGEPVVSKGEELREDIHELWETSDNPIVHKIQDWNEALFTETDTALCFKEIRQRDPYFSLPDFIAEVEETVRPVLSAYQKGDAEALKKYCAPEMIERCKAEHDAYESHGYFVDNKILHISELSSGGMKMMGSTPIIIIQFQTQQIYCVRDKEGSITDGGEDTIHTVNYNWAMQLVDTEDLGEGALYPVWKVREMQQLGVQILI